MTRKHFVEIARITRTIADPAERRHIAEQQAAYFAEINPAFNRRVYLTACGVEGE